LWFLDSWFLTKLKFFFEICEYFVVLDSLLVTFVPKRMWIGSQNQFYFLQIRGKIYLNEILIVIANFKGFFIESIIFVSEHCSEKSISNY
jgi:hypothetical protein